MSVIVKFNGIKSGIADSKCMLLEDIYDLSSSTPSFVKYKNDSSYIIFCRQPGLPPVVNGKANYPGSTFSVNPSTGQIIGLNPFAPPPIIYIYRGIRAGDNSGSGPVCNIYNGKHELFYTSRKTPLQIERINKLDTNKMMNPFENYVVRTDAHKLMVFCGVLASYASSFFRELNVATVWGNGHMAIGSVGFAGGDGSAASIYTDVAITAYAPDL
ncbi:hypothetical protein [Pragia fontium]|uniref:hypothetical protein n=1 Tax=Pragia fontium TaxID=82985 RepID=UPI00064B165C|nr:hypothetical protein [Pragia fontium]AKJ41813.1 hypothetical protein QQ39_06715 [Pragia fontium]